MKRTRRAVALLATTALMAVVAMAGAPSAFAETFAVAGGIADAHAAEAEAHIEG